MQEQHPYNITPEQGWSKMRPALDHAMPADRPSRRFGFLWWSTSAVLMSGVLGLFVFKGVDFFTQPIATKVPSVELKQQNKDASSLHTTDKLNVNESSIKAAPASPIISTPNQKAQPTNIKADHQNHKSIKALTPAKITRKPIQTEPIADANSNQKNSLDHTSKASSSTVTSAYPNEALAEVESANNQVVIPIPTLRYTQATESIPVLYATGLETNETHDNLITPVKANKVRTSTPLIEPTISASGLIGLNGGVGGSVNIGVDVNISRRFSVTTGVGYLGYRPDAIVFSGSKDLSSNADYNAILNYDPIYAHEGINTYVDGTSFNSAAGYNAINPLVENLHQWQVSGGVKWKMTPRFYMDAGVIVGFGTTAYSEYPIVSGDPLTTNASVKIGNTLNSYDVIRSTMTSLYAGIGYNAGKHFDVFAQWTHGLDSYILSDLGSPSADLYGGDRTDYIRGLNLGLKYTL